MQVSSVIKGTDGKGEGRGRKREGKENMGRIHKSILYIHMTMSLMKSSTKYN